MENLLFLGVPILKHIRVDASVLDKIHSDRTCELLNPMTVLDDCVCYFFLSF